jgi:hypothetical protein
MSGATTTTLQGGQGKLEVLLRCCLTRGEELPPAADDGADQTATTAAAAVPCAVPAAATRSGSASSWAQWLGRPSEGLKLGLAAILGVLLVVLANWAQLGKEGECRVRARKVFEPRGLKAGKRGAGKGMVGKRQGPKPG